MQALGMFFWHATNSLENDGYIIDPTLGEALDIAIVNDETVLVGELIERKVKSSNALHWAVFRGNTDLVNELLTHGYDPKARRANFSYTKKWIWIIADLKMVSPIDIAMHWRFNRGVFPIPISILDVLVEQNKKLKFESSFLRSSIEICDAELVAWFLSIGSVAGIKTSVERPDKEKSLLSLATALDIYKKPPGEFVYIPSKSSHKSGKWLKQKVEPEKANRWRDAVVALLEEHESRHGKLYL